MTKYKLVLISGEGHIGIHDCFNLEEVQIKILDALSLGPKSVTFHVIDMYRSSLI